MALRVAVGRMPCKEILIFGACPNAFLKFLCYNGKIALSMGIGLRQTLAVQCLPVFIRIAYFKD